MKRNSTLLSLVLAFAAFGASLAYGGTVRIIANPSVKADSISASEIKSVFLQEQNSLRDGSHVEPVLSRSEMARSDFLSTYIGLSENDLQTYYRVLVFTGRGSMPKVTASDADTVAYVARTKGAIGYVSSASGTEGVKMLRVQATPIGGERKLILQIEPDYPETLKQLKIGGIVRLRIDISARGDVEKVYLIGGNPILGEAAAVAVKKWIYAPARSRTTAEIRIEF